MSLPLHLITGIGGQDGILLARLLVARGERVIGTISPDSRSLDLTAAYLDGVDVVRQDIRDVTAFADLVTHLRPSVVHNLAALSSVGLSWKDPDTTRAINQDAVLGMLDVLLEQGDEAPAFVQASSAEIFGPVGDGARVDEQTPLNPTSPYAEAKAGAHLAVISARDAGLRASNLVLFGHTSVLHAPTFALPSITRQAAEVALGVRDAVELANPSTTRDWGAADDFVRAFALVAEGRGDDFVVATGVLHQLREVAGWALAAVGADPGVVSTSGGPGRPHDFGGLRGDPAKAAQLLGWRPTITLRAQIERMTAVEMRRQTTGIQHDPSYLGTVGSA